MKKALLLCLLPFCASAQKVATPVRYELRGVVTYFFNENQGNKPDIGAKAFIVRATVVKAAHINIDALEKYLANHDLVEFDPSNSPKPEPLPGEPTANEIRELEPTAMAAEQSILKAEATSVVTADGAGVFLKKLAPGDYIVLIRSANRTRINLLESLGQVVVRRISVRDDDKEVSVNFRP